MKDHYLAPDPQLMESMRAVGYTLETAVADIIDNSLTAGADQVDVLFTATPEARIAVLDNGSGMDEDALVQAMQLAGRPQSSPRQPHDLGRFGLGLKTASLSQARSVTVATRQSGVVHAVRWDLDHLADTGKWALQVLNDREVLSLPWYGRLADHPTGTLVLWDKLDQLHAPPDLIESHLDKQMLTVRDHLALVFHRFINSVMPPLSNHLSLRVNGAPVPSIDPFLTSHKATRPGQLERIRVSGELVTVQPFTLPHISKLRASDKRSAQVGGTLRDTQGFYVYRAGRLLLWGTWFRILPRDELGKLARVQVDLPNSLDHLWALDIKKSSAAPPPEVRRRLAQVADQIVGPSQRTHIFRGRPPDADGIDRVWRLIEERGAFRYEINRSHPLIALLQNRLDPADLKAFAQVLRAVEASFPVEDAYSRMGRDSTHAPATVDSDEMLGIARTMQALTGAEARELSRRLALVEPFTRIVDLESFLREALGE